MRRSVLAAAAAALLVGACRGDEHSVTASTTVPMATHPATHADTPIGNDNIAAAVDDREAWNGADVSISGHLVDNPDASREDIVSFRMAAGGRYIPVIYYQPPQAVTLLGMGDNVRVTGIFIGEPDVYFIQVGVLGGSVTRS